MRPRSLRDFISDYGTVPEFTRDDFDRFVEAAIHYGTRRRPVLNVPRPDRHGVRVTQYEPLAENIVRLEADTSTFTNYINEIRTNYQPTVTWHTDELIPWDAITRADNDYWPEGCAAIAPKPQTEEGIQLFFDRHPELRGAR